MKVVKDGSEFKVYAKYFNTPVLYIERNKKSCISTLFSVKDIKNGDTLILEACNLEWKFYNKLSLKTHEIKEKRYLKNYVSWLSSVFGERFGVVRNDLKKTIKGIHENLNVIDLIAKTFK